MSEKKINILCSSADKASRNIEDKLISLRQWKSVDISKSWEGLSRVLENKSHRIIEIEQHHIYQDKIDEKMKLHGYDTDLIIVASKHKSSDGRTVLTAHFTGNVKNADFGGRTFELSTPAPFVMCSILRNMQRLADGTGFEVNMESTHHGPTDISTPMVYAEIGSGEEQWSDSRAAEIVAKAILEAHPEKKPVAIGIGGGHYASRQTKLLLEENITFGHNFPNHQLGDIDTDLIQQAFEKSGADFVYFDRKSMPSRERDRIQNIIRNLGYIALREGDIREIKGLDWDVFLQVRKMAENLCLGGRFIINEGFRTAAAKAIQAEQQVKLCAARINEQLLQETSSVDREAMQTVLEKFAPIYIERENGTISGYILGVGEQMKITTQDIINECIKILKEHYEVKYIPEENLIYIVTDNFSPEMAKGLGISPGPLYGKLANKETIIVNGKTIGPELVHMRKIKEIPLTIH
jgi:D-aminoacyl-tRNA deacylase